MEAENTDKELIPCWLCDAIFRRKTDLNRHLCSAAHQRLTVLCPWCHKVDRYFSRLEDLSHHVDKKHTEVFVPRRLLVAKNAFYIARFPMDYATIVFEVSDYESDDARSLRKAVREWANGHKDTEERMKIWSEGWKEGFEVAKAKRNERSSRRSVSRERSVVRNGGASSLDVSVYSRELGVDETLETEAERSGNNSRPKDIRGKGDACDNSGKRTKRKRSASKERKGKQSRNDNGSKKDSDRDMAINRSDSDKAKQDTDRSERRTGKELDQNGTETQRETKANNKGIDESGQVTPNVKDKDKDTEQRQDEFEIYEDDIVLGEEAQGVHLDDRAEKDETNKSNIEFKQKDALIKDRRVVQRDRLEVDAESFTSHTETSSSDSCTTSSSSSVSEADSRKSLRNRARALLTTGVMPLCPPARRIFTRNIDFDVFDIKMSWPPKNWKELSPENRLFAMEQMALFLERKNNEDFPTTSKKLLCDKYSFLMLDGQDKPPNSSSESEKIPEKIRQYNFSFLRGLARGEIEESPQAWSIVKSLETADRWKDTDELLEVFEKGGVKVKI